jgi:alkylhydroperoxidase/carboxymuconolactone decarboxylase family protein YurZ|tara:strand:- start:92 stop:505 length:414 start_codon:yes stop_codon:yes gene_type:complete
MGQQLKEDKLADKEKFEQGREVVKRLFGDKRAAIIEENLGKFSPGFQEFVMDGFTIYDRPGLDWKMRSAVTIATLTATGRAQELVLHVRGGIRVGLTEEQIREIIMQVALYAGVPGSIEAFIVANKIFDKIKEEGTG